MKELWFDGPLSAQDIRRKLDAFECLLGPAEVHIWGLYRSRSGATVELSRNRVTAVGRKLLRVYVWSDQNFSTSRAGSHEVDPALARDIELCRPRIRISKR